MVSISETKKRISVIFRGSESVKDWYYDLYIFKQLLDEHNAEFFFDCYKITKDSVKTTHWREIENYAMKMTKEKYKL